VVIDRKSLQRELATAAHLPPSEGKLGGIGHLENGA
jgi:hypothetical protein